MRILRLVFFTGLVFCSISSNTLGQQTGGGQTERITLTLTDVSLKEALSRISSLANITFSYSSRKIPIDNKINIIVSDLPVIEVLHQIFDPIDIDFQLVTDKIVLKKSKYPKHKANATISGHIRDRDTGETLIGATVLIEQLGQGVISNTYGFYSLTLPSGIYTLRYSYIGYESIVKNVTLKNNVLLDGELETGISELQEIVISPHDSTIAAERIHANIFTLEQHAIVNKPTPLGEPDVIKALESVPGVQLFRDGSTYFNVRGGARDQNQILVDEAPIYNPAHFLGLFSSIIPEVTKDIKVYRGDLPAHLGGRISSVIDIKTKDGNMKEVHVNGNVGLVAARFAVEGPIKKDKSSFFVSGRRSYIFDILTANDSEIKSLFFSDFTGKVNFNINSKNRLYFSTYSGRDEFLNDGGIKWENNAGTIRWNHIYNDKLFSNTTIYSSRYEYNLLGAASTNLRWRNSISNGSLKMDFTKYIDLNKTLHFGFRASGHSFNPGNVEDTLGNLPVDQPFIPKRNATDFSLYVSKDHKLSDTWHLTYGLRLSTWSNIGKTIEYEINDQYQVVDSTIYNDRNEYNNYSNLEPRFSATYIHNLSSIFKFNYSRSAQYINLISNSISPFNNLEVWLPASVNIEPQIADQLSMGWFLNKRNWKYSVESYYKWMANQLDYADQARLILNPHLEAELRSGNGRSYGFEVKVSKETGQITGSVSYAYSRSLRKIEGINNGYTYPTLWDRPHQISLNLNMTASPRTTLASVFYLSSGSPITSPVSFYEFTGRVVPIYGKKNNDRLPVYHRFDISMKYRLNKSSRRFVHHLTFSIFNFYAQNNDISQSYNKRRAEDDSFFVPSDLNNTAALVPSKLFVYSIVPSISYSFKW